MIISRKSNGEKDKNHRFVSTIQMEPTHKRILQIETCYPSNLYVLIQSKQEKQEGRQLNSFARKL